MININTLNELNNIGIGADINRLESYIIDYKQCESVTNMYRYENDYLKLSKILKEIKQDSVAFTDKTSLQEIGLDEYDELLLKYPNRTVDEIYGVNDENVTGLCEYIDSEDGQCIDMVALPNISGLDIRCSYTNGYIYRINLIGDGYKYTDLTAKLKEYLPKYVEQFSKYPIIELRGKLTIFNNHEDLQNISLNIECSTMHLIRLYNEYHNLSMVFDDIIIDVDDKPFNTQWDKLEYMRGIGFSVPHHALIRNVESSMIPDAFSSFRDYFKNVEDTTGILYRYFGYQIRDNNKLNYDNEYSKFNYIFDKCDYRKIYTSKLKSVLTLNKGKIDIILKIVEAKCNDDMTIDKINVRDTNILNTYDMKPGCKVYFYVNGNEAILINNRQ